MADKPDPTKDSAFKKVVDYFLRTPPQPQPKPQPKSDVLKKRGESQQKGRRPRRPQQGRG